MELYLCRGDAGGPRGVCARVAVTHMQADDAPRRPGEVVTGPPQLSLGGGAESLETSRRQRRHWNLIAFPPRSLQDEDQENTGALSEERRNQAWEAEARWGASSISLRPSVLLEFGGGVEHLEEYRGSQSGVGQ